jgi:hypothetical protein
MNASRKKALGPKEHERPRGLLLGRAANDLHLSVLKRDGDAAMIGAAVIGAGRQV